MNAGLSDDDVSIEYYDGDYPSQHHGPFPENFDETTVYQGLAHDVARYLEIASETGGSVLELCCGTGRVALPLARAGFNVTGVDVSSGMLKQFEANLRREDKELASRVRLVQRDVTQLALDRRDHPLGIIAFNSLLCIPDFEAQCRALAAVAAHLAEGGVLVLDIINPLVLKLQGDPVPKPFFTRRNPRTGNFYTRFAMMGELDAEQKQRLHGWYDETDGDGRLTRKFYSISWRPIFRYEIELMLKQAGMEIVSVEGGHLKEPFTAQSPRMFIRARKSSA